MDDIQRRLFNELERANHYAFCDPTPEAHAIALSAMRRYRAYVERDYRTLWVETEALLSTTRTVLEAIRADLAALDLKVRDERAKVIATIQEIERLTDVPRRYTGC